MLLALFLSLAQAPQPTPPIILRDYLVISGLSRGGRTPVRQDTLELQIVRSQFQPPKAGDTIAAPNGQARTWSAATAKEDGSFEHQALRGGYALAKVNSETARVAILEASGHNMVYVNGEPRMGDPYSTSYVHLPVQLKAGENTFLFSVGRGSLKARLTTPSAKVFIDTGDLTLPDLRMGEKGKVWAAVPVINATAEYVHDWQVRSRPRQGKATTTRLPDIPPFSVRKVGFEIETSSKPEGDKVEVTLELVRPKGVEDALSPTASITLGVRQPGQTYKRTFISQIDGSVQYYGVNPMYKLQPSNDLSQLPAEKPALVLSLHGASVEGIGQASAYSAKSWAHIVSPTNRRPFGFDWEDWGRMDMLEVLGHAESDLQTDPAKVYLTGHSMGGHGTWINGVTFPGRFAAIAPSAGWVSFFSYGGGVRQPVTDPIGEILQRASNPSDTQTMASNLGQRGVYILHGDADDNVPVTEARTMKQKLTGLGIPFGYHEEPKAGHWWENSDEPGAECVDWPGIFDLFSLRRLPRMEDVREIDFTTANPGISSTLDWATIEQQTKPLAPSRIKLRCDPHKRRFSGSTENVARLQLNCLVLAGEGPVTVELDGQKIEIPFSNRKSSRIWLVRSTAGEGGKWSPFISDMREKPEKTIVRSGPFKEAFNFWFYLVYGTSGTPEENAWAENKARFDAEQFWVRGNGSVQVISDRMFEKFNGGLRIIPDEHSVILYGNADTNSMWKLLMGSSPVQVNRTSVTIGSKQLVAGDLACLFVRPKPSNTAACVAAVSGTGIQGMRLTDRMSYFTSGSAFPDILVSSSKMLEQGLPGILAAGFFGNDWSVEKGDIVIRP